MNQISRWFRVDKRIQFGYDVHCLYCGKRSKAWDYKKNAYLVGIVHVVMNHMSRAFHQAKFE